MSEHRQRETGGEVPIPGRPTGLRNDEDITQSIRDLLAMDGRVNVANVAVRSVHGTVTLTGIVSSAASKAAAEEIARSVPGVVEVRNEIIVVPAAKTGGR